MTRASKLLNESAQSPLSGRVKAMQKFLDKLVIAEEELQQMPDFSYQIDYRKVALSAIGQVTAELLFVQDLGINTAELQASGLDNWKFIKSKMSRSTIVATVTLK